MANSAFFIVTSKTENGEILCILYTFILTDVKNLKQEYILEHSNRKFYKIGLSYYFNPYKIYKFN